MKIVHIFPTVVSGASAYIEMLIDKLKRYDNIENIIIQNELATVNSDMDISVIKNNDFQGLSTYKICNLKSDLKNPELDCYEPGIERFFDDLIKEINPDIVHFHYVQGIPYSLLQIAYLRGCKVIASSHNTGAICPRKTLTTESGEDCIGPLEGYNCAQCSTEYSADEFAKRYKYVINTLNKYTDCIITVANYTKRLFRLMGIHSKINVLRVGTETEILNNKKVINTPVQILYGGGFDHQKGLLVLLEALREIDTKKYQLNIHGKGNQFTYKQLKSMYPDLNMIYHGKYSPSNKINIIDENDIVVIPSIGSESAPLMLQESLARKLPGIVSTAGGIQEYIDDGITGSIFEKGNIQELHILIKEYIENPSQIQKLSNNIASTTIRNFSDIAREHVTIYNNIVQDKRFIISPVSKQYYEKCRYDSVAFSIHDIVKTVIYNLNEKECNLGDIVIFGTGKFSDYVLEYLDTNLYTITGFFDNNTKLQGQQKQGVKIYQPTFMTNTKVVIASAWTNEIYNQLLALGYDEQDIIKIY